MSAEPSHDIDPEPALRHRLARFDSEAERRTWWVLGISATMMAVEIVAGWVLNSMALFADGWHMGSHTAALGITLYAYYFARRHAGDPTFSFGTGKVSSLGGFASGIALGVVALMMGWESIERLITPEPIRFDEAIGIASVGMAVNVLCAWLLSERHVERGHGHGARDHNLRAAYLHVLADALTSVLAILALIAGRLWGLDFLDPLTGCVGALVILYWTLGLLRQSGRILLDCDPDPTLRQAIRQAIEQGTGHRVTDLHVWALAPGDHVALVRVAAAGGETADELKRRLPWNVGLRHALVEVTRADPRPAVHAAPVAHSE